jgi:hypothetical protein
MDGFCTLLPACAVDTDCPLDLVCEDEVCVRPCVEDTDCPPVHSCIAGHCIQQCFGDDTCQDAGTICEDGLCVPAECQTDADCEGENIRCQHGRCETYTTCVDDSDCTEPNHVCIEQICEELPTCAIDSDCESEDWCADTPCICVDEHCHHVPPCESEDDCGPDQDCVGGLCVPHVCRGPDDCEPGEICVAGECVLDENPSGVARVVILTPGGPIHQGESIQLEAVALDAANLAIAGVVFDWASSETARADVDAAGMLTGGAEAGDTDVTATAGGVTSDAVVFTNFLDTTDDLRVVVVEVTDRAPLAGVTVHLSWSADTAEVVTDANGEALFTDPGEAVDVHVFSDAHDYVSVLGTISKDILVPLPPRSDYSVAGGFTGQMTYPGQGSVSMGLAGTSIGGCLVDLNLLAFLGEMFNVTIEAAGYSFDMVLPSRMVIEADVIIPIVIKDTYYSVGHEGLRAAWAMGGKLDLEISEILDMVQNIDSIEEVLTNLLPYFAVFDHAVKPAFMVDPIPLVADADDIDGDNDTTELRPHWGAFDTVDLAPLVPQDMQVQVTPPDLPSHGGVPISTAVYLAGSLSSMGLTPLGITAAEAPEGVTSPMTMRLTPAYGGLESGRYALMVLAFAMDSAGDPLGDVAMVMHSSATLPTDVAFETGFLAFPDATWTAADRTMVGAAPDGATLLRSTIQGASGRWEVYMQASPDVLYTLPDPPAGMDDLATGDLTTLDPIALGASMTFEDLVTFNGDDLDQINRLATALTRHEL